MEKDWPGRDKAKTRKPREVLLIGLSVASKILPIFQLNS